MPLAIPLLSVHVLPKILEIRLNEHPIELGVLKRMTTNPSGLIQMTQYRSINAWSLLITTSIQSPAGPVNITNYMVIQLLI